MRDRPTFSSGKVRPVVAAKLALLGVATLALAGCDGEDAPPVVQVRDNVVAPTATATQAPPPPSMDTSDASTDSPYGVLDDGGYAGRYAYSPLQVCKQCGCDAGSYCFGGGTGYTAFSGTCSTGATFGIGCQPLPTGCGASPDCACLFDALKGTVPCYLVCSGTSSLTTYCPSP